MSFMLILLLVNFYQSSFFFCYSKILNGVGYKKLDDSSMHELFFQFVQDYQKNYTDEEYIRRFFFFKANLLLADVRNEKEKEKGGSAIHGITQFSDFSIEESEKIFFGAKLTENDNTAIKIKVNRDSQAVPTSSTFVNWAGVYTTPIKTQGPCMSCWAFSASEQVESDAIRLGWSPEYPLSTQQLVDCVTTNSGCKDGNMINTYEYLKTSGLVLDSDYPYVAVKQICAYNPQNAQIKVLDYTFMNYDDPSQYTSTEVSMSNYVLNTGPLSVYVAGTAWLTYSSGILASCDTNLNHMAQIVGLDTVNSYWIVRNAWGPTWGESGYIRLQYMTNQCSIASYPSYVVAANF